MHTTGRSIPITRLTVVVAAALVVGSSTPAAAQRSTQRQPTTVKEATPGLAARATVSADSATARAMAAVPNGRIQEAELEEENGRLVYSYDIKVPGRSGIDEVLIDAKTGVVVSKSHESPAEERREKAAAKHEAKPAATTRRP